MKSILIFIILFAALWMTFTTINVAKPGQPETVALQAFEYINDARTAKGIKPLIWDDNLANMATAHSIYMSKTQNLEHSDYAYAENIAQGGSDPKDLYTRWANSPLHNMNMIDSDKVFGAVGIGVVMRNVKLGSINITIDSGTWYSTFLSSRNRAPYYAKSENPVIIISP